jgi:lipid A oxidase
MKFAVALAFLAGSPAFADWNIDAYLGVPHTLSSPLRLQHPPDTDVVFESVSYRGEPFTFPLYYGYRAGYFSNRHFGLEGELIHLKMFSDPSEVVGRNGRIGGRAVMDAAPLGDVVQRFSISHGLNLVFVNAVVRAPVRRASSDGRVSWVARVGAGPTVPHAESMIAGITEEHYEVGRIAIQAAGGVELKIARGAHVIGEYKFTRTAQRVGVAGGTASARFATHHVVFGAGYRF